MRIAEAAIVAGMHTGVAGVAALAGLLFLAGCATPQRDVTVLVDGKPVQSQVVPDRDDQHPVFVIRDPRSDRLCKVEVTLSGTFREPAGDRLYWSCWTDCRTLASGAELAVSRVGSKGEFTFACSPGVTIQGRSK